MDEAEPTLSQLVATGRRLLDVSKPTEAHLDFRAWDDVVARWLDRKFPEAGLSAQWSALPNSRLVVGNQYRSDPDSWATFQRTVAGRLAWLGDLAEKLRTRQPTGQVSGWQDLLHPVVHDSALAQYAAGHWRDAVLNAFIAVFDLVRRRTELDLDGDQLVTYVFSANNPRLVVADLSTESGRNDQVGFMLLMQGAFRGIRNPKAHSLQHDLDGLKSAQYLIMASLLARRVDEAELRKDGGPV